MVKAENSSSAVIFFSDHGEEIYDSHDFRGHSITFPTKTQCEIPFLLWLSDKYKTKNPDIFIDEKRPFSTEHFIHSISTLGKLKHKEYNPNYSLFSSKFVPQPRFVGDFHYTEIIE
jgi:heptose-I-phosphate ethanolaminephosphotransferase